MRRIRAAAGAGLILLVPVLALAGAPNAQSPYAALLKKKGIPPDAKGVLAYLEGIRPSPESAKRIDRLIKQLGAYLHCDRQWAQDQLSRMGLLAEAAVKRAALSKDAEIRCRAEELLAEFRTVDETMVLHAALETLRTSKARGAARAVLGVAPLCAYPHVQRAAARALAAIVTPPDEPVLRRALKGTDPLVRRTALPALAKLLGRDRARELHPFLGDADTALRLAAARTLADLGERKTLTTFVELLAADKLTVRLGSAIALREFTGQQFRYTAYGKPDERAKAIGAWRRWVATEGRTAKLTFPLKPRLGATHLHGNTLLATGYTNQVLELDPSGKTVWSYTAKGAWSAEKLANGNVLIAAYSANKVLEVTPGKKVVWEFGVNCLNAKPLATGNILIADHSGKRAIEVTRAGKKIVWQYKTSGNCCDVQRLANGNTLIGWDRYVREVSPDGKTVWEWAGGANVYGCRRLPNGNTLISDITKNRVFEVTPDKKTVWEFTDTRPGDAFRLPNGNTLVTGDKRFVEVTPGKKIVWSRTGCRYGTARK